MRSKSFAFLATALIFILASIGSAYGRSYHLIGRELSPGVLQAKDGATDGVYRGALFLGKIFDETFADIGYFSVLLDRVDEGVEICGETTGILALKLSMTFNNGSRLVLVMPSGEAEACWNYDDPDCPGGCLFPGYDEYLFLFDPDPAEGLDLCGEDGDNEALIAEVPSIHLKKQWLGSWGPSARRVAGAELNGWLIHTPLLFPAVYGTVALE